MEYRRLGRSGLQVSALSYGAWVTFGRQLDTRAAKACMKAAFDAGANFFDNAEVYADGQAEVLMGQALKELGWQRSEYLVSTKIFWGGKGPNQRGLSRKHIIEGTDAALRRLQVDYVDLIYCHRPDSHTPIEETVRAMNHVIDQGKALYWGTSEWSAEQIMAAHAVAQRDHLIAPTMEQPQYNMLHRQRVEKEYLPLFERVGMGTTIWSPLAGGLISTKYLSGIPDGSRPTLEGMGWLRSRFEGEAAERNIAKVRALQPIAEQLGCSLPQLGIAWCAKNPHVSSVITGASRPEQVVENMQAANVIAKLDDELLQQIEAVLQNRPEPDTDWRE